MFLHVVHINKTLSPARKVDNYEVGSRVLGISGEFENVLDVEKQWGNSTRMLWMSRSLGEFNKNVVDVQKLY